MLIITERNLKKFGNDDIETLVYDMSWNHTLFYCILIWMINSKYAFLFPIFNIRL